MAYQALYEQNGGSDKLCYLIEILDSAMENFPHLWVNGEKYVFSDDVIEAGQNLFKNFKMLESSCDLDEVLQTFEDSFCLYEQYYVYELMVIEQDARRFIIEAIEIDKKMTEIENTLNQIGCKVEINKSYNE